MKQIEIKRLKNIENYHKEISQSALRFRYVSKCKGSILVQESTHSDSFF